VRISAEIYSAMSTIVDNYESRNSARPEADRDDSAEEWNELRDRAASLSPELSLRQLDVLADFGVRRLERTRADANSRRAKP
jgi:hypothetical protein